MFHSLRAIKYMMYIPNEELIKQFTSSPNVPTFFSSVIKPLIEKYRKPPAVKARHSFK